MTKNCFDQIPVVISFITVHIHPFYTLPFQNYPPFLPLLKYNQEREKSHLIAREEISHLTRDATLACSGRAGLICTFYYHILP